MNDASVSNRGDDDNDGHNDGASDILAKSDDLMTDVHPSIIETLGAGDDIHSTVKLMRVHWRSFTYLQNHIVEFLTQGDGTKDEMKFHIDINAFVLHYRCSIRSPGMKPI